MDEGNEPTTDTADEASSEVATDPSPYVVVGSATEPSRRSPWLVAAIAGAVLVVGLIAASQVYLITTLGDARDDLDAARADVAALEGELAGVSISVDEMATDVAQLNTDMAGLADAATSGSPSDQAGSAPAGYLPRFVQGQADAAIGLQLGALSGPDAYTGDLVTIDPADGTKRMWMVWAHWCPYCQQELPELAASHDSFAAAYPDIEITTITSSIDPTRGNPLADYLETSQFPFPVIVDDDLAIAGQLGVSAFPFWIVTDGDGTVLLRSAGYLGQERVAGLMASLADYDA
jgi:thiol-disulfide isomerase/thioredoxin